MIHFNALYFIVCRSEEVMFLLTLSVDACAFKIKLHHVTNIISLFIRILRIKEILYFLDRT